MFGNLHVFPGGTQDPDDSELRVTAVRELAEETGVIVEDQSRLALVSRWITPKAAPQRFDTLFFAVEVDRATPVTVDQVEVVSAAWATPDLALSKGENGEWSMILPTLSHLRWLSRRDSIAEVFAAADGTDGGTVIEPIRFDDGRLLPILGPALESR